MNPSLLHQYILAKPPKSKGYRYTKLMVNLLHKVSSVPASIIETTRIYPRSARRYIPFYPAHTGGGAITLGSDTWSSITFTENFFSTDQERYHNRAYANAVDSWLYLSAHEVGHLIHAVRYRFFVIYIIVFIYQYAKYGHDAAPLEIEADIGRKRLRQFNRYICDKEDKGGIRQLVISDLTEQKKIELLEKWWTAFEKDP